MGKKRNFLILRDEARVARMARLSKIISLLGLLFLVGGLVIGFSRADQLLAIQALALLGGWIFSQVGLYIAHRYVRQPRPDLVLDEALAKVVPVGRLYHFLLPAPHVLLTPAGPIVFHLKYQSGRIRAEGDVWEQKGGLFRRIFGQEGLGNPTREAEKAVAGLARYIQAHAPELAQKEIPIGAIIVFTTREMKDLDVKQSRIPALHASKLRGYVKQMGPGTPLPAADQQALQAAFDQAAAGLLPA